MRRRYRLAFPPGREGKWHVTSRQRVSHWIAVVGSERDIQDGCVRAVAFNGTQRLLDTASQDWIAAKVPKPALHQHCYERFIIDKQNASPHHCILICGPT